MHKSSYIHEPCNSNAIFLHLPFATWNYLVHQFQLPQESPELVFPTKTTCVEPILVFPWMMHCCNIVTNENSDVKILIVFAFMSLADQSTLEFIYIDKKNEIYSRLRWVFAEMEPCPRRS